MEGLQMTAGVAPLTRSELTNVVATEQACQMTLLPRWAGLGGVPQWWHVLQTCMVQLLSDHQWRVQ